MASASITLNVHGTDPEVWDALARVFGSMEAETSKWVQLQCDGVYVNFFKTKADGDES